MRFLTGAFMSSYAVCKIPFNTLKNEHAKRILLPILILPAILLIFLTCLLVFPFACYRALVHLYLKLKYGNKFIKILNFLSATFRLSEYGTNRFVTYILCDNIDGLEIEIRAITRAMIKNIPELSAVVKKCCGYYYLLKRNITVDDVFSMVSLGDNEIFTEEKLCYYFRECEFHSGELFQVRLFKDPLEGNRYVYLCLMHHSISDGHDLLGTIRKYMFDEQIAALPEKIASIPKHQPKLDELYLNPQFFRGVLTDGLHPQRTGPYFALFTESNISCIPKLKTLKKKFNCTFDGIMMALITYSLCQYMKDCLETFPKTLTMCYVSHINPEYRQHFRDGYFPGDHLSNNTLVLLFHAENLASYGNFGDFVDYIQNEYEEAARSTALQISHVLSFGIFDFLPEVFYRRLTLDQHKQPLLAFSNVGVMKPSIVRGRQVVGCFGGTTINCSGLYASFISYDDRLHVFMESKLCFLKSRNDLQIILDNAMLLVHKLYRGIGTNRC